MSDLVNKPYEAQSKFFHCRSLLTAYDAVIDDLADWDEDEWVFVRKRIEEMRAGVAEAMEKADEELQALSYEVVP